MRKVKTAQLFKAYINMCAVLSASRTLFFKKCLHFKLICSTIHYDERRSDMVHIEIAQPERLKPTSLSKLSAFVSFEYDSNLVSIIKSMGTRVYIPDKKTWEINNLLLFREILLKNAKDISFCRLAKIPLRKKNNGIWKLIIILFKGISAEYI